MLLTKTSLLVHSCVHGWLFPWDNSLLSYSILPNYFSENVILIHTGNVRNWGWNLLAALPALDIINWKKISENLIQWKWAFLFHFSLLNLFMRLLKPREGEELVWVHTASKGRAGPRTQVCWLPNLFSLGPATFLSFFSIIIYSSMVGDCWRTISVVLLCL